MDKERFAELEKPNLKEKKERCLRICRRLLEAHIFLSYVFNKIIQTNSSDNGEVFESIHNCLSRLNTLRRKINSCERDIKDVYKKSNEELRYFEEFFNTSLGQICSEVYNKQDLINAKHNETENRVGILLSEVIQYDYELSEVIQIILNLITSYYETSNSDTETHV
ncbi:hypothetical protein NPIL_33791 [Nephila pilipes]|uniref:Uncharacterized protein n=1 Tax=Nephila pilipes TaxID=299642 RepID=A0A8X6R854_NEPPI|nr:hypothetical protein NPIL_33791 [Nephila pilipes]